jgi:hypothetical protein
MRPLDLFPLCVWQQQQSTDCCDCIGAQSRNEEDVNDCKHRFHGQFQDHGDRQQQDGLSNASFGKVSFRTSQRLANISPKSGQAISRLCLSITGKSTWFSIV